MRELTYYQPNRKIPTGKCKENIIRVTGVGEVSIQPNRAEVTLGVTTEDLELQKAQKDNAKIINNVKNGLNALGIQDEFIRTVNYSVYPQYDFSKGEKIFRGYRVEHLLLITIDDIEKVGLIVDNAVQNGANIVSGIAFTITDPQQYELHALSLAVVHAYQKAEAIAGTLRVQLTKAPIFIAENYRQEGGPVPFQATTFLKSEATTPIQPGLMKIKAEVTAEFVFLP